MKIVFDANVLIAAFATRGFCNDLWELCANQHELFTCDVILDECANKFYKKIKLPHKVIEATIIFIKSKSVIVTPVEVPKIVCRDIKDLPILGCAIAANADVLVTGDEDLLVIEKFNSVKIIRPRALWSLLCSSSS